MSFSRILVTGAAGFVGQHMLRALRAAYPQAELIGGVRAEDAARTPLGPDIAVLGFDLADHAAIAAAVIDAAPDLCVHLAAEADVAASFSAPDRFWHANAGGTRALAAAILAHAPQAVLVHAGSAEIYGLSFQAGQPLREDAPLQPANPYAVSKAAADLALGELALRGLRVARMRALNHIGPGQSARFAIAAFARQIARIEAGLQPPVIETGALDRARDFLDVRDVCAAYLAAAAALAADRVAAGAAFNIASGTPRMIGDVLAELCTLSPVQISVSTTPAALRPLDIAISCADAALARTTLGWQPAIPWAQTLSDILADWRGRAA